MDSETQNQITVQELGSHLYDCADDLRGNVDKGDYKDYILPLVFYAGINRQYQNELEKLSEEQFDSEVDELDEDERELLEDMASNELPMNATIPDDHSWEDIKDAEKGYAGEIDDALTAFTEQNEDKYSGLHQNHYSNVESFTDADGDEILETIVGKIDSKIYKSEKEIPPDVMGEAFMYLVKRFAEAEAGEYFTPPKIVKLMVQMLEPFEPNSKFHDPTVGSGGMLVEVADQIERKAETGWYEEEFDKEVGEVHEFVNTEFDFSGQELNPDIASIAKMNLALHDISGRIRRGNSLSTPRFTTDNGNKLEKFDYILANFPFSESGWKSKTKERAKKFGDMDWSDSLPHGNYGDFAFIMHMVSHMKDDGQMATVIPHGVLFRNGDQEYRQHLIENDYVEAIVGLPENLFEATGIPAGILVLNMDKPEEREDEVLFMNLDHEGEFYRDTGSDRFRLLEGGIDRADKMFDEWGDNERVSRVVDASEIAENEYNLNIALYVDTTEPQEDISVKDTLEDINDLENEYESLNEQFTTYMQQLNYQGDTNE